MTTWIEDERLLALKQYDVLDTPPEEAFDELVAAAAQACGVPMAAVSLIDENRQWFKARIGLDVTETPRDVAFCAHAIEGESMMVVPDATADARFADNPLVLGAPDLRFYAGAVIRTEDGLPLGALCVLDTQARPLGLSTAQSYLLRVLADQVAVQLKLRRLVLRQRAYAKGQADAIQASLGREDRLLRALHSGAAGWWDWDVRADRLTGNAELGRAFGLDLVALEQGVGLQLLLDAVHPTDRPMLADAVDDAVRTGDPFREEFRVMAPEGHRWVSARGLCLPDIEGGSARFPCIVIDISDRKRAEQRMRDADVTREMAMNAARLGSWDHDLRTGRRFYDRRALELLGLDAADANDPEQPFPNVHPEDRDRLTRAVAGAIDPERSGPFRQTFRVADAATGGQHWLSVFGRTQFADGACIRFTGVIIDVTEERQAQEHLSLLTHELNHRVKNTLAVTASIVDSSMRSATDLASARRDVSARLVSYGRAHDLLTAQSWSSAAVAAVVEGVVETMSLPRSRLELSGPALRLGPKPSLHLSLALHELATNAVKYGAFSNDTGRVTIAWSAEPEDGVRTFRFTWIERGGPTVTPPTRRGFGTKLIQMATAAEFDGDSHIDYAPAGMRWSLRAPYDGLPDKGRAATD